MSHSGNGGKDIFEDAIRRLDTAFKYSEIDPEALELLKHPKMIIQVSVPVRMDDGSLRIFDGYRVRPFIKSYRRSNSIARNETLR